MTSHHDTDLPSHRGPHPADSVGLGGFRAELVEPQRRRSAGEQAILEQLPAPEALGLQTLEVLPQILDGVVVLPQAVVAIPLAPQLGGHAGGTNGLHHPERTQAQGQLSLFVGCFVRVEQQQRNAKMCV